MTTDALNMIESSRKYSTMNDGAGNVQDLRTQHIQDKRLLPDYTEWQRTTHLKTTHSSMSDVGVSERPTSPDTEIVRLQIKARRKTLQQYQKMQSKLVALNLELMGGIKDNESGVHEEVTALLEQYDKFRGAIGNIRHQSEESIKEAIKLLEETKQSTTADLESLEKEVDDLEAKVEAKANECEVLLKFKGTDKEYHLRAARMNELRAEKENLKTEQKTERSELAALVDRHHANLNNSIDIRCKEIQATLTASAVKNIPDTLRELAQQNRLMQREILLHKDNIEETEEEIDDLKSEISMLQGKLKKPVEHPKIRDTCTPDMELSLDIPTYQLLPV